MYVLRMDRADKVSHLERIKMSLALLIANPFRSY